MGSKIKHVVDTTTETWYHLDEDYKVYTCSCTKGIEAVSLCLTLNEELKKEGEIRELDRKIADRRKELGLLQKTTIEEIKEALLLYEKSN